MPSTRPNNKLLGVYGLFPHAKQAGQWPCVPPQLLRAQGGRLAMAFQAAGRLAEHRSSAKHGRKPLEFWETSMQNDAVPLLSSKHDGSFFYVVNLAWRFRSCWKGMVSGTFSPFKVPCRERRTTAQARCL